MRLDRIRSILAEKNRDGEHFQDGDQVWWFGVLYAITLKNCMLTLTEVKGGKYPKTQFFESEADIISFRNNASFKQ